MMTQRPMNLEAFYTALSDALDAVGAQGVSLLLTKLALLLAHELGDAERARALIEQARLDL